jgi:diaminohydroxyphosphoribosylaminopyrimidine deaminase/5-amino-6-(5-phosphoribosylamino)uracil reductase
LKPLSKKNSVTETAKAQSGRIFPEDRRWMRAALGAARRGEGRTGSNPAVGCVLVSADGHLLAEGHTGRGGVPHAEAAALASLSARYGSLDAVRGGTAYVTLEPCAHHGKTPPCSAALIGAGIGRLVVGVLDPDPRVNGAGLAAVEAAGIRVSFDVEYAESVESLKGFLNRNQYNKPYCSLKVASSIDGRIALADRQKRWITGPDMRRYVHLLRSRVDAIVTGVGTVISDDPQLTCRIEGLAQDSPLIFVFDSHLRLPPAAALLRGASPVTVFCREDAALERQTMLRAAGGEVVCLPLDAAGHPDIGAALEYLGSHGVNHLLVEAGTGLATAFLAADAVDRIYWTQSDHILGNDALPAV